jgi:hypothetical protein
VCFAKRCWQTINRYYGQYLAFAGGITSLMVCNDTTDCGSYDIDDVNKTPFIDAIDVQFTILTE